MVNNWEINWEIKFHYLQYFRVSVLETHFLLSLKLETIVSLQHPENFSNVMQTNNRENQNKQIPSAQGRAAEATDSINTLLAIFFNETSAEDSEEISSDLVQICVI